MGRRLWEHLQSNELKSGTKGGNDWIVLAEVGRWSDPIFKALH